MTGVTSCGVRTLNRNGENTITRVAAVADPRIFTALQMYVPPCAFVTLYIFMVPSCTLILSPGKLPTALDHVILGDGWPVAVHEMATFCFSSAISRLNDNECRGPTAKNRKSEPVVKERLS